MALKEYKAKKMQDPEFARAYEEIQPEMEAIRGGMASAYLEEIARMNIEGIITFSEAEKLIEEHYR